VLNVLERERAVLNVLEAEKHSLEFLRENVEKQITCRAGLTYGPVPRDAKI
jgi:hypothetical protein